MLRFRGLSLPFRLCDRVVRGARSAGWGGPAKPRFEFLLPGMDHPLEMRYDSSDRHVFRQIFIEEEYRPVNACGEVSLIVDCGAYAGLSGRYFLQHFPHAQLVCIEPNPDNFQLLQRNMRHFAGQVTLINKGVWSCTTGLRFRRQKYRDGREWSFQVEACAAGETPDLEAVGLSDIAARFPGRRIDLLKMDVERAEIEIFSRRTEEWLPRVRNIAVELHDEQCRSVFFKALQGYRYESIRHGDLTLCTGITSR